MMICLFALFHWDLRKVSLKILPLDSSENLDVPVPLCVLTCVFTYLCIHSDREINSNPIKIISFMCFSNLRERL